MQVRDAILEDVLKASVINGLIVPLPLPFPGSFATEAEVAVLHELNVYTAEKNQVQVRTLQVGHLTWCWGENGLENQVKFLGLVCVFVIRVT